MIVLEDVPIFVGQYRYVGEEGTPDEDISEMRDKWVTGSIFLDGNFIIQENDLQPGTSVIDMGKEIREIINIPYAVLMNTIHQIVEGRIEEEYEPGRTTTGNNEYDSLLPQ